MEGYYEPRVLCTRFEYVLLQGQDHIISVIDPVSGSVSALPVGIAEGLACPGSGYPFWIALGQVASTGEYKLVRIVGEDLMGGGYGDGHLCEVFTFGEGIGHWWKNDNPAAYRGGIGQWRKVESPPAYLDPSFTNGVVVKGAAYYFFDGLHFEQPYIDSYNIKPGCIPSFNLETEQWSVAVQGPISQIIEKSNGVLNYRDLGGRIMLGEHKDFLVTVHYNKKTSTVDLWFLMDAENSLWSRQHIIQIGNIPGSMLVGVQPVLVLDDGRIILLVRTQSKDLLQIYSPGTNNATVLQVMASSSYVGVGIYTGSLLC
ncbi:hypothetical protein GQ55_2G061000 [Panicum hallii var. hallii]|uniref:F-box associated beta-propeller type 3 domain-containing protein n=1 Tax=Panicum hallii var. hallii TaxID=1504633 RepID=A0A2T7ELZ2_9POAL|nr:hypothetical protein GQ55_2G061000 [Panicum hallii var. hallii]